MLYKTEKAVMNIMSHCCDYIPLNTCGDYTLDLLSLIIQSIWVKTLLLRNSDEWILDFGMCRNAIICMVLCPSIV